MSGNNAIETVTDVAQTATSQISSLLKDIAAMDMDAIKANKMAIPLVIGIFIIFYMLF